jgi:uncharacterized protein YutE (UPF0331/DUF86 family)
MWPPRRATALRIPRRQSSRSEQNRVIDAELAGRLRRMVGFRNIAVHEYQTVDPAILEAILEKHVSDLRTLGTRIIEQFGLEPS